MKRFSPILLVLALAAGFFGPTRAAEAPEILTALDVAEWLAKGSTNAEIADLLSTQRRFDRGLPPAAGKTAEQIINYLITQSKTAADSVDEVKARRHKLEGDRNFAASQFEKAAHEYTLGIKCSNDNSLFHKMRADAYKKILATRFSLSTENGPEESKRALFDRTRALLCGAVYSDYRRAKRINWNMIQDNAGAIYQLTAKMGRANPGADTSLPVEQYYNVSAQKPLDMRQLHGLYQAQRAANQTHVSIRKALSDYELVCREEETARLRSVSVEKESKREKKWVKYGEAEDTVYYYDPSDLSKSKDDLTVWTLRESTGDESYSLTRVKVYCKGNTFGTLELMDYDEMGRMTREFRYGDHVIMVNIAPGSVEQRLLQETCK